MSFSCVLFVFVFCVRVCVSVEMTCALIFSKDVSSPERTLEVKQPQVGMGSTHTILTHSPAPDVSNGKASRDDRIRKLAQFFFLRGHSRSLSLATG